MSVEEEADGSADLKAEESWYKKQKGAVIRKRGGRSLVSRKGTSRDLAPMPP